MSTFGSAFRVTTYGESHCASVGAIIDGCPPVCNFFCCDCSFLMPSFTQGLQLAPQDIQVQLSRRRPGQSDLTTPVSVLYFMCFLAHKIELFQRDEKDLVHIQSGLEYGVTLGTPIGLLVKNEDHRPKDYSETDSYPRPSHADWTYLEKYGVKASSGGGRSSARETIGVSWLFLSPHIAGSQQTSLYRSSGRRCNSRKISQDRPWNRDCRICIFSRQGTSAYVRCASLSGAYGRDRGQ